MTETARPLTSRPQPPTSRPSTTFRGRRARSGRSRAQLGSWARGSGRSSGSRRRARRSWGAGEPRLSRSSCLALGTSPTRRTPARAKVASSRPHVRYLVLCGWWRRGAVSVSSRRMPAGRTRRSSPGSSRSSSAAWVVRAVRWVMPSSRPRGPAPGPRIGGRRPPPPTAAARPRGADGQGVERRSSREMCGLSRAWRLRREPGRHSRRYVGERGPTGTASRRVPTCGHLGACCARAPEGSCRGHRPPAASGRW